MPGPDPLRFLAEYVVPRAVDAIDLNEVLGDVDMDELLGRVDVDALLDRVDINGLLDRVDVERLLDRVDVDRLLSRVDVESLVGRVDIAGVVRRAQVDAIVRATAGGLGTRLLNLFRRQLVGLDALTTRVVDRLLGRKVDEPVAEDGTFTGQVAGGASRLAAFLIDAGILSVSFTVIVAVVSFLVSLFVGHHVDPAKGGGWWHFIAYIGFAWLYQWVSLVVAGRTVGRAVAGLRVTAPDRSPLGIAAATRRTVVYPFSFVLGLGLVGIVTSRRHRALHDIAAPSLVYYDWGDRPAAMPAPLARFLEGRVELDGAVPHEAVGSHN